MSEATGPKFACAACGREFRWKPELAGKKAKCKCGATVEVPRQAPREPEPVPADDDVIDMSDMPEPVTPRPYRAGGGAGGGTGTSLPPPALPPQQVACPVCSTPAPPTAVLCTNCGYNFRTGVRMPGAGRGQALAYATKGSGATGGISADTYAQAAKAAWMAPLIAFGLGCCTRGIQASSPAVGMAIGGFQILLILGGIGCGVFALVGASKHGAEGILLPAITGLVLNLAFIGLIIVAAIALTRLKPTGGGGGFGGGGGPPPRTTPMVPRR
jgi:hypothetical protein